MQLISLNAWSGCRRPAFADFLQKTASATDIYCFQEVSASCQEGQGPNGADLNLLRFVATAIPNFQYSFFPMHMLRDWAPDGGEVLLGNAMFWKSDFSMVDSGGIFVHGQLNHSPEEHHKIGILQFTDFLFKVSEFRIVNIHGMSAWPKKDTSARIIQARNIRQFIESSSVPTVVCGDFNLLPETESISLIGEGMQNLAQLYGIETTRSEIHREKYKDESELDTVSDYMFLSPGLGVKSFEVPELSISDHLPLVVNFN